MKAIVVKYMPGMMMVIAMIIGQQLGYWCTNQIQLIVFEPRAWPGSIWVIVGGALAVISGYFCLKAFYADYARKSISISVLWKELLTFALFGFGMSMLFTG
jgi:hypothetical protein